jgi:hypothetical protein
MDTGRQRKGYTSCNSNVENMQHSGCIAYLPQATLWMQVQLLRPNMTIILLWAVSLSLTPCRM